MVRTRPTREVWSALEYACHVRDALGVYHFRIDKVLTEERPSFPMMGRDDLPEKLRYNEQNPAVVVDELAAVADRLADLLASVPADAWDRIGVREGEELSIAWMARNIVHEGNHHLLDIGRVLRTVRGK